MKEDSIHVEVLRHGRRHIDRGVLLADMVEHIKSKGYLELVGDQRTLELRVASIMHENFTLSHGGKFEPGLPMHCESPTFLSTEGAFRLFELEELLLARKSATSATLWAAAALLVSIGSGVWSVYSTNLQRDSAIKLDAEQFAQIRQQQLELSKELKLLHKAMSDSELQRAETLEKALTAINLSRPDKGDQVSGSAVVASQ